MLPPGGWDIALFVEAVAGYLGGGLPYSVLVFVFALGVLGVVVRGFRKLFLR